MKFLCFCVVFVTAFVSTKCQRLRHATEQIDAQIDLLERTVIGASLYNYDFDADIADSIVPEDKKKRLMVLKKVFALIKENLRESLKKHNIIMRRILDFVFPSSRQLGSVAFDDQQKIKEDYVKYLMEQKNFFLHEVPRLIIETGKELGVEFQPQEFEEAEQALGILQRTGAERILNVTKDLGMERVPLTFS